jgi:hypothetical protein
MKTLSLLLLVSLFSITTFAQEITGQWNGLLKVQGIQLRLVFHIEKTDDGYSATMDSPDQKAFGIPASSASFEDDKLNITIASPPIVYEGTLGDDQKIIGMFKQGGQFFPLNLSREEFKMAAQKRPQEPSPPFAYNSEDIIFKNNQVGISLAGTLTTPKEGSKSPAVILISGSGAQNRDSELMGHKPFLVLSDYFTRNGIAVLRYDDRGTAKSEGEFAGATSEDFASDVQAAVAYLKTRKEINPEQIGLFGHSEGGLIAPMVASKNEDVAFIVLIAGPGIRGDKILLAQQELIGRTSGMTDTQIAENETMNKGAFDIVVKDQSAEKLKENLTAYMTQVFNKIPAESLPQGMTKSAFIDAQLSQMTDPWMQYFIKYDPAPTLEKVTCPVLALNGENDLQVPSKLNLDAIRTALKKGENQDITTVELPGLNHLFQKAQTGAPSEYSEIEETFSTDAMKIVADWIKERFN